MGPGRAAAFFISTRPMALATPNQYLRPRIKQTIEIIEAPNGELHLMRATGPDVRLHELSDQDRSLLAALDGSSTMQELKETFGVRVVSEALGELASQELLEDASDFDRLAPDERERFDRQLRYFSDVATGGRLASDCHDRLRNANVAILGLGGLGGRVALELACCGVGRMELVDADRVELSNFNRQIQFSEKEIGLSKAECMASRVRSFNSGIDVEPIDRLIDDQGTLQELIEGATIVIDAADWPAHEIEHWCNAACFNAGVPYIAMSHFPPIARVGPLYVPGETGCYQCQIIRYRRDYPLFDIAIEQRKGQRSPAATFGPACGLIGGLVATEVVHFLTALVPPAAKGVGFTYDLRDMTVKREQIEPEPSCSVCSN